METKFARFLRSGGNGEFVIGRAPTGIFDRRFSFASKMDIPGFRQIRSQFEANLDRADLINQEQIFRFTRGHFSSPLEAADLADVTGDKQAALVEWDSRIATLWEEWSGRPDRFPSLRRAMEDDLITSFAGLINERRQRGLGIDQYTWRSRDDAKVRDLHAEHDDQEFSWDDPPEGGHPGQGYNCRCFAEPLVITEPAYVLENGISHIFALAGAEVGGIEDAGRDFVREIVGGVISLPGQIWTAGRLALLVAREARDTLTPDDAEELRQMRQSIDDRLAEVEFFFKNTPEIAAAVRDYLLAIQRRPGFVDEAYHQGLATEAQVQEAFRDRAYLATLLLLNVLPAGLIAKLLRRRGRLGDLENPAEINDDLIAEAVIARRHPSEVDWDVFDNPGIVWGGAIRDQGGPWEEALAASDRFGIWIEGRSRNFPTFDFYDDLRRIATSAKTLDTQAFSYVDRPSRVYGQIKAYIDRVALFDDARRVGFALNAGMIDLRRIELAVPYSTSPEQIVQIQRAIEHATSLGIEMNVRFVR